MLHEKPQASFLLEMDLAVCIERSYYYYYNCYYYYYYYYNLKSSMARSLPVENLLPQNVGSIINYLQ